MGRPKSCTGIKMRKLKCPRCGKYVYRPILDETIGPGDGRAGNAHIHKCFLIFMNPINERIEKDSYALNRFQYGRRDKEFPVGKLKM